MSNQQQTSLDLTTPSHLTKFSGVLEVKPVYQTELRSPDGVLQAILYTFPRTSNVYRNDNTDFVRTRFTTYFSQAVGFKQCHEIINSARTSDVSRSIELLHVLSSNNITVLNNPSVNLNRKRTPMDIFNNMHENLDKVDLPNRLIAPSLSTIIENSHLEFITVETISDLLQPLKPNTVITFRPDQFPLLNCFREYSELFGVIPTVITGVPNSTYTGDFEAAVWDLVKVPYHTVVNDLIETVRRGKETAADVVASSVYNKEQAQITRKNGTIKEFTAFDMPGSTPPGTPSDEPDQAED